MGSSPAGSTNTNTNNYGNNCNDAGHHGDGWPSCPYGHTSTQHGVGRVGSIQRQHQTRMEKEQKVNRTSPWVYAGLKHPMKLMVLNRHTSASADLNGILECCSIVFNVTRDDILGQCRKQEYALARHAFVKLARERTQESFTSIADFLGKRNHATAVNGKRRAEALIETYKLFRDQYEMCESLLNKAETVKETYKMQQLAERLRLVREFKVYENGNERKDNE